MNAIIARMLSSAHEIGLIAQHGLIMRDFLFGSDSGTDCASGHPINRSRFEDKARVSNMKRMANWPASALTLFIGRAHNFLLDGAISLSLSPRCSIAWSTWMILPLFQAGVR